MDPQTLGTKERIKYTWNKYHLYTSYIKTYEAKSIKTQNTTKGKKSFKYIVAYKHNKKALK